MVLSGNLAILPNKMEDSTVKAYCCSNFPQTEAELIAKFDLVHESVQLLAAVITVSVVLGTSTPVETAGSHSHPQNLTVTDDPSYFFHWPVETQAIVLFLIGASCLIRIVLSAGLLIGVKKKKHILLLIWFIATLICLVVFIILGVIVIIAASSKVMISIFTVMWFLYKWYCLWIVKLSMSEVRAVREGYTNPLEDGEIDQVNNLVPSSDSFTVDKF